MKSGVVSPDTGSVTSRIERHNSSRSPFPSRRIFLIAVAILAFAGTSMAAARAGADELLVQQFWAELHPLVAGTPSGKISRDEVVKGLLEEARFVFSGMIYGFDFTYVPYDASRKVAEQFDLHPIAEIPWGDPNLQVLDTRVDGGLLHVRITYSPADFQTRRYVAWSSNVLQPATGRGTASYYDGPKARSTAMEDAIKNAIREYARQRIYNKPKEIRGSLSLVEAPYIIIEQGKYVATAKINLRISDVVPYTVF